MFALKTFVLLIACVVLVTCQPMMKDGFEPQTDGLDNMKRTRFGRSPQHGSVDIGYSKDQRGREASVQYNHNLYTSRDGRGSIDAYAQGSRNFDHNRNNFGGGIQGKWRF